MSDFIAQVEKVIRSAKNSHALGVTLIQVACGIVALMFFYGAYTTVKKGFKVTESKVLTGNAAKVIATVFVLIGIAIIVFAIFYLPALAY